MLDVFYGHGRRRMHSQMRRHRPRMMEFVGTVDAVGSTKNDDSTRLRHFFLWIGHRRKVSSNSWAVHSSRPFQDGTLMYRDAFDVSSGGSLPSMVASGAIVRPAMKVNLLIIFLRA